MNEPRTWIAQAKSDYWISERFVDFDADGTYCHAIAKYQQTVEKSIKAVVVALREANILHITIGRRHDVERFLSALRRLPRSPLNQPIQNLIFGLLNESIRADIRAIDCARAQVAGAWRHPETEYRVSFPGRVWSLASACEPIDVLGAGNAAIPKSGVPASQWLGADTLSN